VQPFRQDYPVNPSWEIAKSLPPYLPPRRAKDPNSRAALPIPEVRIVTPPEAIEVSYRVVRATVPKLWDGPVSGSSTLMPDIVLHIGMAGALPAYFLERRGHRTGYKHKDVNGEFLEDQREGKMGEDWIWYGLPDEIESDMDVPDVMERWKGHSPVCSREPSMEEKRDDG
jgi:pyroglutamyl-peptidase